MALSVIQYVELPLGDEKIMFEINTETNVQLGVLPCSCTFYVSFMYHISRRFTLLQFFMLSLDLFFLASLDRRGSKWIKVPKNLIWVSLEIFQGNLEGSLAIFVQPIFSSERISSTKPAQARQMQGFRNRFVLRTLASTEFAIAIGRFGPTWGIQEVEWMDSLMGFPNISAPHLRMES